LWLICATSGSAAEKEPAKFATVAAWILPKHTKHEHSMKMELMSDQELAAIIAECEEEIAAALQPKSIKEIN
jgi:hypothetical protein